MQHATASAEAVALPEATPPPSPPAVVASEQPDDDEDDEEGTPETGEDEEPVVLGFLDTETPASDLTVSCLPSKTGGWPAWLVFDPLPDPEVMQCGLCGSPMPMLLQLYCPLPEVEAAFHRMLYLFCCRKPGCHTDAATAAQAYRVLRAQLPEDNPWFGDLIEGDCPSHDSNGNGDGDGDDNGDENAQPVERRTLLSTGRLDSLCVVCGCYGPKKCSQCKAVRYCSREHQLAHWKAGHKQACEARQVEPVAVPPIDKYVFLQRCIDTEDEPTYSQRLKLADLRPDVARYKRYLRELADDKAQQGQAANEDDEDDEDEPFDQNTLNPTFRRDRRFLEFSWRTGAVPDQVVRYCVGGAPLWLSDHGIPAHSAADLPACSACGAARRFEFQVLPQLLYILGVETHITAASLDWGTLAVYTCSASCTPASDAPYLAEVLLRQPPVTDS